MINSLRLLQNLQYRYKTPVKKNGKLIGHDLESVKIVDYKLFKDEKTGQITKIKDLRFSRDYLHKFKTTIAIPYGKGVYYLTEFTHQKLDNEIQLLFTNRTNIKRTTAGEPLVINAKEFKKIYKDYSIAVFYNSLPNGLDKLAEVKQIGRWHTKAGGQTITSRDIDSQTLYIYPADIHDALITSDERKAIKMEQASPLTRCV